MSAYDSNNFVAMFQKIAERLKQEREALCVLDGEIGDADHGIAMAQGFGAVAQATGALDTTQAAPTDVLNFAAKSFLSAVGASSGPLYATAFMRAAAAVKGKDSLAPADVVALMQAMARGIQDRGKAVVGEKTMVDAWAPAVEALDKVFAETDDLDVALAAAARAANDGAKATREMIAGKGRSSRLGERARGHVDPGAASAAMVIEEMAASLGGADR